MPYNWCYTPICVRFITKNKENENHSFSGIHLILKDSTNNVILDYMLTISHIPMLKLEEFSIIGNSSYLNGSEAVNWYECKSEFHVSLFNKEDEVYKFLSFFHQHGFKLIPNDVLNSNLFSLNLICVSLKEGKLYELIGLDQYRLIEFGIGETGDSITINSFPFNFTNSILFSNFVSNGSINYTLIKNNENLGYLTDITYLENMAGGIVNKNSLCSLGLVLGNLKKLNGDGDLIFVLPWGVIWKLISKRFNNKLNKPSLNQTLGTSAPEFRSVLPIVIIENNKSFWGSSVYFNETTLITNNHVIKSYEDNPSSSECLIYLSSNEIIKVSKHDSIITPFRELDLSFIKLSKENQQRLKSKCLKKVTFGKNYQIGDEVKTISYGLFFNSLILTPIQSTGIISTKLLLPFYSHSSRKITSIIVTTSSCWNGSSGGGLFDNSGNLLGIICSNAQVKVPTFNKNDKEHSYEKLSKFSLCLPIEVINECYKKIENNSETSLLNYKIENIWSLKSYHDDLIEKPRL